MYREDGKAIQYLAQKKKEKKERQQNIPSF